MAEEHFVDPASSGTSPEAEAPEAARPRAGRFIAVPPRAEVLARLPYLMGGLIGCGIAFSLIVAADLGLDPWNVLHQGISAMTGIGIGTVSILVAVVVLLGWIPLRERLGLGTIANAITIGATMDLVLAVLPQPDAIALRWAYLIGGLVLIGPAIGFYIGARLGPGPRDGIMTGVAQRGPSIRLVRTIIELSALVAGIILGGTAGIGTVLFALTVGPNAQWWLERVDRGFPPGFDPMLDPVVAPDATLSGE